MSPGKLVAAGAIIVLLFAAALGFASRDDESSVGDPSTSRLGVLTRIFPQRALTPGDLENVDCFDQAQRRFVVPSIGGCAFAVPDGVKRIEASWIGPGLTTAVLTRDSSLTQTYRSQDDPQDQDHPDEVAMPVFGDGTTVQLTCAIAATCLVGLR